MTDWLNRFSHASLLMLVCVCTSFFYCEQTRAQSPIQRPPQIATKPDVGGNEAEIPITHQELPKELEQILDAWEQRTKNIDRMQGDFRRYEYDSVFAVEKRTVGRFWFESPDKARMDFQPDEKLPNPPQNKVQSKIYTVMGDDPKSWICTGEEILDIDLKNRTYNRVEIPVAYQGKNITNGPLPFLFGMKADDMKARYRLSLGEKHDVKGGTIHIIAYPLVPALRREFQRAELLLSVDTFHPIAIKLWDPAGSKETVYMFFNHKIDKLVILPIPNPFKPFLGRFKLLQDHKAPIDGGNGAGTDREARNSNGVMVR